MSEFDVAIAVSPTAEAGVLTGQIGDTWRIGNGVNGGVLMALAANGLRHVLDTDGAHSDPLAVSAYFLSPSVPDPAILRTEILRVGRTMSTGEVSLRQPDAAAGEVERMRMIATFGDLREREAPMVRTAERPTMPPPHECLGVEVGPPDFLAHSSILDRMELRIDPATAGWATGKPSHAGVLRSWVRLADGREPDVMTLIWALDALPPVAFDLGFYGWTPTLEFSAHLRRRPAPGWLLVELTTENVAGGLLEEDARAWDSQGRFVAQSRQLCGFRMASASGADG